MESEIDVIAFDQRNLLLGECKYRSKAVGVQELESLRLKGEFVQAKGRQLHYLLASKSGFTNELLALQDPHVMLVNQA